MQVDANLSDFYCALPSGPNLVTNSVQLRIDLTSNSSSNTTSCTNSACSAKGFDCCIEGQCVTDGAIKTNAAANSDYAQAMSEYNSNPLSFINWPNIFYICSNVTHSTLNTSTGTSTSTSTALSTAQKRVAAYLDEWNCLNEVASTGTYTKCIYGNLSNSSSAYNAIKYSLAVACGCTATTQAEALLKCPDWGIRPLYKSSVQTDPASIVDFYCYIPAVTNQVGQITNLNVNVSARSVPHRFYATDNTNYDDLTSLPATVVQEGDNFYYLDELNKAGPVNGSYNMNSILGRMVVDLSKAAPAKVVNVDLGTTYIISTISGYFTPCVNCAKDSWFQSFFSHPATQNGTGLQFSGYSTQRDAYAYNTTLGNYEDTQFGRACFIPPTMIPLSHQKAITLQTQRLNRLKTQAAYYINGYQRDWFGFNQGALIGSFDGVTWFAIGTGRRITSTSTKLFLAYNASYLDLAAKTETIVNIIPDTSKNTASNLDYNPDLAYDDPSQGTAATCQKFHQCQNDSDCITQLGWEYTCADVSQYKTTWPSYDSSAKELPNQEKVDTLFDILSGTTSTTYTKRCVYRGAGAPCKQDYSYFNTSGNTTYKKLFTCAPNFYCASLGTNKFNDQIVRSPNEFDNIYYGFDTNVLGRPMDYVTANKTLPNEVISNIQYASQVGLNLPAANNDMGICRPGKGFPSSLNLASIVSSHANSDLAKRTDYISQIGSCDSNALDKARTISCPVLGKDLNYLDPSDTTNTTYAQFSVSSTQQNMCGAQAKLTSSPFTSPFTSIEGVSLNTLNSIPQPILAKDACLRKAGAVCHTDLDCGPNIMHESLANILSLNYFGGTEAERSYWSESLICGQGPNIPAKTSSDYFNYNLNANRCCREVGKDFTMYTKGDSTHITDQTTIGATTLDTALFTYKDPKALNRYSRYEISPSAVDSTIIPSRIPDIGHAIQEPVAKQWMVLNETGSLTCCGGGWIRKFADGTHKWPMSKKLSIDASNFSCLNFRSPLADSTFPTAHPEYFYNTAPSGTHFLNYVTYQKDYGYFCFDPVNGGCMQATYSIGNGYEIVSPEFYYPGPNVDTSEKITIGGLAPLNLGSAGMYSARMDTSPLQPPSSSSAPNFRHNVDAPYSPAPFVFPQGYNTDSGGNSNIFFLGKSSGHSVAFYLPSYIGWDGTVSNSKFITNVAFKYYTKSTSDVNAVVLTSANIATAADCKAAAQYVPDPNSPYPADYLDPKFASTGTNDGKARWCITSAPETGNRPVLIASADTSTPGLSWDYAGIVVDFIPVERYLHSVDPTNNGGVTIPGNDRYYLSKLSRLELLGIPQITYEPLYCNNDSDKLVPGIFKSNLKRRSDFVSAAISYSSSEPYSISSYSEGVDSPEQTDAYNPGKGIGDNDNGVYRFTFENLIDHPAIFSSKDFTCCTPLGKTPKNGAGSCCSGYATTTAGVSTCKLPFGTDIHVYFNKFVSSEGVGADQPGGGLIDNAVADSTMDSVQAENLIDFNSYTGEPKMRDSTDHKLYSLGTAYCDSGKVIGGAAFGAYPPEPYAGSYNKITLPFPESIVDSIMDFVTSDQSVGKIKFDQGNRWNHHYYCN